MRLSRTAACCSVLSPGAQNQKRGFAAALEQGEPIGGASIKVNRLCDRLAGGAWRAQLRLSTGSVWRAYVRRLAARELPSSGGLFARRDPVGGDLPDRRADRRPPGVEGRPHRRLVRHCGGARGGRRGFAGVLRRQRLRVLLGQHLLLGQDGAVRRGRPRLRRADHAVHRLAAARPRRSLVPAAGRRDQAIASGPLCRGWACSPSFRFAPRRWRAATGCEHGQE